MHKNNLQQSTHINCLSNACKNNINYRNQHASPLRQRNTGRPRAEPRRAILTNPPVAEEPVGPHRQAKLQHT